MSETTKKKITPRHKILAFYMVGETYTRMSKFTQFSQSKNAIEYSRQYCDEPFQQTDVVGFSPSVSYAFDRHSNDPVLADVIEITDKELIGDDAVRSIIIVNTEDGSAVKRDFSVIPSGEGDNINIYTYSGTLKCRGEKVLGTATTEDDWQTVSFKETTSD